MESNQTRLFTVIFHYSTMLRYLAICKITYGNEGALEMAK